MDYKGTKMFDQSTLKTAGEYILLAMLSFGSVTAFMAAYHEPYMRSELILRGFIFLAIAICVVVAAHS